MKILSISIDNSILDKTSRSALRVKEFGRYADEYIFIVPSKKKILVELSKNVAVYGSGGGNKLSQFFHTYVTAVNILRKSNFDMVTIQDIYFLAWLGIRLARKFSIGSEIQVHGFEKYRGIRRFLAHVNLSAADSIRVVSKRLRQEIVSEFKVSPDKIIVAQVYIDAHLHQRQTVDSNDFHQEFMFLTVGRLVPIKDICLQIEALSVVRKKYPQARLTIVGDGPERGRLESLTRKYDLETVISFVGRQSDVAQWYMKADAFLLTSRREGWGMVVAEAAGYELPIIMTNVGCAGDFIIHNQSGIIVPVGGKNELVKAMQELIIDPKRSVVLGKSAYTAAMSLPSFDEVMRSIIFGWNMCVNNYKNK